MYNDNYNVQKNLDFKHRLITYEELASYTHTHTPVTSSSEPRSQSTARYVDLISLRNLVRSLSCNYRFCIHRADSLPESVNNVTNISAGGRLRG